MHPMRLSVQIQIVYDQANSFVQRMYSREADQIQICVIRGHKPNLKFQLQPLGEFGVKILSPVSCAIKCVMHISTSLA